MLWLFLVLAAHFINAVVFVLDKYYIDGPIPEPKVYAFYESLGGIFWLILIPFGVIILPFSDLMLNILGGFIFSMGLIFFYDAIKRQDIANTAPIVGALTALFTLVLSLVFLDSSLNRSEVIAFILLVLGTFLVAEFNTDRVNNSRRIKELSSAIIASGLFALFFVAIKYSFMHDGFVNAFFWTRIGMVVASAFMLVFLNKNNRIVGAFRSSGASLKVGFFGVKLLAGFAFLLIAIAVYLGDVTLVNAMQGTQYMFLILISLVLSKRSHQLMKQKYTFSHLFHQISAVLFIASGLFLLGLNAG